MQLHDVGVMQHMVPLDGLAVEDACAPDPGRFQRVLEVLVNVPGEVEDGATDGQSFVMPFLFL